MDLWAAVGAGRGSVVTLIGAGGKTASMLALAEGASAAGYRVLVTTTTRIWKPDLPLVLGTTAERIDEQLAAAFRDHRIAAAGAAVSPEGKLFGVPPSVVCSLRSRDVVLCEGDGAAGRSLKIHRKGEPVVPGCTTHFLVIAGLDALGRRIDHATHPASEASQYFREAGAASVREEHVIQALLEGAAHCPPESTLVFILNKTDEESRIRVARGITGELRRRRPAADVLLTSRGQIVHQETGPSA